VKLLWYMELRYLTDEEADVNRDCIWMKENIRLIKDVRSHWVDSSVWW
jgi:hypothetical protein